MADTAVQTRTGAAPGTAGLPDVLAARLQAISLPKGGFSAAARADALARLTRMGLPGPRDEYWRYTDPAAFNAATPAPMKIAYSYGMPNTVSNSRPAETNPDAV